MSISRPVFGHPQHEYINVSILAEKSCVPFVRLEAADRAVQVFGGRGYSELFRPGRHWKDVRVCRIYEGTDEVLKLKIAVSVLGKEYGAFK